MIDQGSLNSLRLQLQEYDQEHLLDHFESLSEADRRLYYGELTRLNLKEVCRYFKRTTSKVNEDQNRNLDDQMEPIHSSMHGAVTRTKLSELEQYEQLGLNEISKGHVAVLLLAGGQGTRLGVPYPKGMYDVGLPSRKTLYQLQAERILKLEQLAFEKFGRQCTITWYIMTSEHTKEPTLDFFASHNFFGLNKENVVAFEQEMLPCFDFEGRIILDSPGKIAKAPDGNGGLYRALRENQILEDMERRKIKSVHVYCVDNILVKMADPLFLGYCLSKGAECGAKVVEKAFPTEAVGVVCKVGGVSQVVEYSEITLNTAQKRNEDGRLTFSAGNICNHYFTTQFLKNFVCGDYEDDMLHHIAKKKVPYCNAEGQRVKPQKPNAIKLEKFVFDIFQFTNNLALWEVIREDEFSPLKNADGAEKDTPSTCRHALFSLHHRYLLSAGGTLVDPEGEPLPLIPSQKELSWDECKVVVEISPLVSYAGEGLSDLVSGKKFKCPLILEKNKKDN